MFAFLCAALFALVTIADHGRVFQPALSPDGTFVAYAAEEGDLVSIYVAASEGGAAKKVVEVGRGHVARRLALLTLSQGPWSPDGLHLLCLRVAAARVADERAPRAELWTLSIDGADLQRVEAARGTVEAAVWSTQPGTERIVFAHRETLDGKVTRVALWDRGEADPAKQVRELRVYDEKDPVHVLELTGAASGQWLALLTLSGPRDARVRRVEALSIGADGAPGDARTMDYDGAPNFLRFSADGERLFFTDTKNHLMTAWNPAKRSLDVGVMVERVRFGLPVLDGSFALVAGADGGLEAVDFAGGGARKPLGAGFAAVSAAGGKLALVRTSGAGAAVLVAELTAERLRAGDLGLDGGAGAEGDGE